MKDVLFTPIAHKQLQEWLKTDKKIYQHIDELIKAIQYSPFTGVGKPEPLKHQLKGYWSRRITKEHRLVYKISPDSIIIVSCKYHY
jgi:toxin YoeB